MNRLLGVLLRLARPRSSWVLVPVAAVALLHITGLAPVLAVRLTYPGNVEWMEDGSLYHAYRLLHGQPLFPAPGLGFMPYPYPPLQWVTLAALGLIFGLSPTLGRALSLVSVLVVCGVLGEAVARKYRSQGNPTFWVLLMLGMVAAGFSLCGGWYDVIRPDSLGFGLLALTGGLANRLVEKPGHPRLLAAAVIIGGCAAVFAKQTNVLPVVWISIYLGWRRPRMGVAVGLGTLGAIVSVLLALQATTSGHFAYYTIQSLARHPVNSLRFGEALSVLGEQAPYLLLVPSVAVVLALYGRLSGSALLWLGVLATCLPGSLLAYAKSGGFDNAFMPVALFGGPVALLVAGDALKVGSGRTGSLVVAGLLGVDLAAHPWDYEAACPTQYDFEQVAKLREYTRRLGPRVLAPHFPFLAVDNGSKLDQIHGMSWTDARWSGSVPLSLAGFLEKQRPDYVLSTIDEDPAVRCALNQYFHIDLSTLPPEAPPLTGHTTWIRQVLKQRPMRRHIRTLFDFESNSYAGWQVIGEAFGARPTLANSLQRQATMLCTEGRYVADSFHPERGDQAQGELRSPEFVVDRGHLSLLVGGGAHTRAELRVEGQRVRVASGPGSEILHEVVWDVRELRGLAAQLVAVDNDVHAGGHIVVDHVGLFEAER